jgi:hypothetical protein
MKRQLYDLTDEEFMTLLERTDSVFRNREIPYMFVGGVATQAHIVNYLCQKEKKTLYDLANSDKFRIQDHLRATDDVDITLDSRKISKYSSDIKVHQEIMEVLNEIKGEGIYTSPSRNHLVSIKLERPGKKRPIFRLGLDKEADSPDSQISLNFYYGPEDTNDRWPKEMVDFERANYFDFFNTAKCISIPFSHEGNIDLNVKGIEQLLATKIARARVKDWADILLLYGHAIKAGQSINLNEVKKILHAKHPRYDIPNETLIDKFEKFKFWIK